MQTTETAPEIRIVNVGPIQRLEIPIPRDGGVVVLRGHNGAGKSTALAAVSALGGTASAKDSLTARYGAKEGTIEAPGIRMRIGQRTTAQGDLAVQQIEASAPARLVDPAIKDPERADAARARALCQILGIEPPVVAWGRLLADPTRIDDALAGADRADATECAAQVKRYLESQARTEETLAERDKTRAEAARLAAKDSMAGVTPYSGDPTADAVDAAGKLRDLESRVKAATDAATQLPALRARVEAMPGLTIEAATAAARQAAEAVVQAEDALREAQRVLAERKSAAKATVDALSLAQARHAMVPQLAALESASAAMPSLDELQAQRARLAAAKEAMAQQARLADAERRNSEAGELSASAEKHAQSAKVYRDSAAQVEPMLFSGLRSGLVEIRDGLLYGRHHTLGMVRFGSLSHGERWRLALELVLAHQQPGTETPILAVAQEAWEGLDPKNREELVDIARRYRVAILTAEAATGELAVSQA
jgi:hypothetical protein